MEIPKILTFRLGSQPVTGKILRKAFHLTTSLRSAVEDNFKTQLRKRVSRRRGFRKNPKEALLALMNEEDGDRDNRKQFPRITLIFQASEDRLLLQVEGQETADLLLPLIPPVLEASAMETPASGILTGVKREAWTERRICYSKPFWDLRDELTPPSKKTEP